MRSLKADYNSVKLTETKLSAGREDVVGVLAEVANKESVLLSVPN